MGLAMVNLTSREKGIPERDVFQVKQTKLEQILCKSKVDLECYWIIPLIYSDSRMNWESLNGSFHSVVNDGTFFARSCQNKPFIEALINYLSLTLLVQNK